MFIHKLLERARCTIVLRRFTWPPLPASPASSLPLLSLSLSLSLSPARLLFSFSLCTQARKCATTYTYESSKNSSDDARHRSESGSKPKDGTFRKGMINEKGKTPFRITVILLLPARGSGVVVQLQLQRNNMIRSILPGRPFVGTENYVNLDYKFVIPDNRIRTLWPATQKINMENLS